MFKTHFQSFDDSSERARSRERVAELRAELKRRGLAGFMVPRADRQQNEYLPASEERLAWLTGFTGSAGAAIVLAENAALFVDGRYTLQADTQVDGNIFSIEHLVERPPEQWLEQKLKSGDRLGYDPWLHTSEQAERLRKACNAAGAELVAVDSNPIDGFWRERPAPPAAPISVREIRFAGETATDKIKRVGQARETARRRIVGVDPQNVAWAFNIRGADVAHTPLVACCTDLSHARAGRYSMSMAASSIIMFARRWRHSPTFTRKMTLSVTWASSRTKPSGSTKRVPATHSPAYSPVGAPNPSAAPIRLRC